MSLQDSITRVAGKLKEDRNLSPSLILEMFAFKDKERLDTEDSIVSYLLKNPEQILENQGYLTSDCFEITANKTAYIALTEMAKHALPIDPVQLEIYLDRKSKLEIVGGAISIAYWAGESLLVASPTRASIDASIDYLVEMFQRKKILKMLVKIQDELLDLGLTYQEVATSAKSVLSEFINYKKQTERDIDSIAKTMPASLDKILEKTLKRQSGESIIEIETGFVDIDKITGGWQRSDLTVIAGATSMGKTAWALNTCAHIAKNHPVLMFSLEMSTQQLNERFLAIESGVPAANIRDGLLDRSEIDRLIVASEKLSKLNYWGNDSSKPSIDFIMSTAKKLQAEQGKLGGIFIDHVGLMVQNHLNIRSEICAITGKSKQIAMELDCPVFLLSQLNRGPASRNNKEPLLDDLKESGSLGEDANNVIMLYRDDYYNPDSPDKGLAKIFLRKHRNGECGMIKMVYDPKTTKFKNYAGY